MDNSEVGDDTASISLVDASSARTFTVSLRKEEVAGVVSSCGDEPKTGSYWAVNSVSGA